MHARLESTAFFPLKNKRRFVNNPACAHDDGADSEEAQI